MSDDGVLDLWSGGRQALSDLGRGLSAAEADTPVPACPEWTVRQVFAHQAGVVADVLAGRMEGAPGDEWTARQVAERSEASLDEILDEWDEGAPKLIEALRPLGDGVDPRLVADLFTHTHDVRGALGRPGDRDGALTGWVQRRMTGGYVARVRAAGLEDLFVAFSADDGSAPRLVVDPFEFVRASTGRRSPAQMRAWGWEVDDRDAYVAVVPFFPPRSDDLIEPV